MIKELSGGNQQKVLLAKWMNTGPALLVLHEPTQAVDIGARTDILHALQRAADSGVAILLVSSEPEDLVATCDRILVYGREVGLRAGDGHDHGRSSSKDLRDQRSHRREPGMTMSDQTSPAPSRSGRGHEWKRHRARSVMRHDCPYPAPGPAALAWLSRYALIGVWILHGGHLRGASCPHMFLQVSTAQAIFGSQSPLLFLAIAALCTFVVGGVRPVFRQRHGTVGHDHPGAGRPASREHGPWPA